MLENRYPLQLAGARTAHRRRQLAIFQLHDNEGHTAAARNSAVAQKNERTGKNGNFIAYRIN